MNKFLIPLMAAVALLMLSCVNGNINGNNEQLDSVAVTATANPSSLAVVRIVDPIVEKYPNYKENSIAQESLVKELNDSLKKHVEIGKPCDLLEGLPLEFVQVAPNGAKEAVVEFKEPYSPYSDKWDASITVYCTMDKEQASKLSRGEYILKGVLQDWKPDVGLYSLSLGEFLIKDAQATPYTF